MTTSLLRATLVASIFLAGCGGDAAPAAPEASEKPNPKAAAPAKKGPGTSRADELIEDLKKREAKQAEIQKAHDDATRPAGIPVVVEVTPSAPVKGGGSTAIRSYSQPSSSSYSNTGGPAGPSDKDAAFWRSEIAVAEARLGENQRKLDAARQRMNSANAQMNDQNATVRKMGQDAYRNAQSEVSALESAVSNDRYTLDNARNAALRAGVAIR